MDEQTDNGWFQHRSTKSKTLKKQKLMGKNLNMNIHQSVACFLALSSLLLRLENPSKPFDGDMPKYC